MKIDKVYAVKVSISERSSLCEKQELPTEGKIRGIVELGLPELDNLTVEVCDTNPDKDARIVELEEHLHALLNYCVETCNKEKVTKEFWRTVYNARECMNKSAFDNLHIVAKPVNPDSKEG